MKILEFGDKSKPPILLIHGFQCPWQIWNPYIAHYESRYRIIIPVLTGHDVDSAEDFISVEATVTELEEALVSTNRTRIFAVYGMSMGGVIAAKLWQNGRIHFERVIFDGSPLAKTNEFVRRYMESFYLRVTHKTQKRDKMVLAQARKSIVPQECYEDFLKLLDHMTDTTICNAIRSITAFQLSDNIQAEDTCIHYFHGTAMNEMLAKQSARLMKKYYPHAQIHCFRGAFHCENALFHPQQMMKELDDVLQ